MMLRVNNEYLEFNADIELERQVMLFEEISKTAGDYSYEFEIELTSNNIRILQCPFPDNVQKNVYHKVDSQLVGNDGLVIHYGYLRIERIVGRIAHTSFFSGNNNWFGILSGPLTDVYFDDLDVEQTEINIIQSWDDESGIVFPLMDNNVLMNRRVKNLQVEDFIPCIYVHTVIKRIFQKHSIKIQGELFTDANYKKLIVTKSPSDEIESRSSYVGKKSIQSVHNTPELLTFDDDSNSPFFDGSQDNYNLPGSGYTADVKMRLTVEASVTFINTPLLSLCKVYIVKNGTQQEMAGVIGNTDSKTVTVKHEMILDPGDTAAIMAQCQGATPCDIQIATSRFTPTYIYVAFGTSPLPNWTQQQFVSNIFRIFNTITDYEPVTKTLTVNLFEKIKSKTPVDISEFVSSVETDYIDFVSNYAKKSLATYEKIEFDDWKQNGIANYFPSGDGFIDIDNDFIDDSDEVIESDFTNPQSYINAVFDMSMERLHTLDLEAIEDTTATSVTDNDLARFNVDDDIFTAGDLVRVSDSTVTTYNGDWVVFDAGSGYVELRDCLFVSDATAKLTVMKHIYTGDDDVYLLFNVPNYSISKYSGGDRFLFNANFRTRMAMAYFNLINMGRQVNDDFTQSLSFGEVDSILFYQRTMLQTYWSLTKRVLNDPVKQLATVNLPYNDYRNFNFLSPVTIKTVDSSNLYYANRITGYKGREYDSTTELIKLP